MERHGVRNCEAIELGLREALFKDGRRLLEQLYAGTELSIPNNASLPGEKCHPGRKLQMHSIFGPVELHRNYFYSEESGTGRFPLDGALGLVESFSPALVRLTARAAAREGYAAAGEDVAALAGISIEGRQIHRLGNQVGGKVALALEQNPNPDPKPIPIMYVEVDATGVPMVADELAGRKGKQEDGTSKTREVKLGCVFTQTKVDEETGLPLRDPDSTTYIGNFQTAEDFGGHIRHEALRRGLGRAVKIAVLGDGAPWIWELARVNFPSAIWIVDLYHALERLHTLCQGLYANQSSWAARTEEKWKQMLKNDQVLEMIAEARKRLDDLGPQTDDSLEKQIAYFDNQKTRMLYKTYRDQGLFYGSGVVEAGCKAVIGQRLKESGMFWTKSGATNVLALRCALKSHRWDECWNHINNSDYLKIKVAA
ncbi:MAG: hypothetical protein JWM16_2522 [Verrucomicrobiales bacterium]|nr:hypothetical protein [Verrucomicrobiales bacterium]